ncbi:MAG: TldD/PmbA family protein [Candidatus Thorarchaeota archaeon]
MKDKQQTLLTLAEKAVAFGSKKVDQIEIFLQDNYEISCEVALGQISKAIKSQEAGASIRVVTKKRLGSAYTNRLNIDAIEESVKRAVAAAKASTPDETWKDFAPSTKYAKLTGTWDESIPEKDPSVFVDLAMKITKDIMKKDSSIIIGEAGSGGFYGWTAYANSNGISVTDRGTGTYAYSVLVAPTDTGMTPSVWSIDVNRNFKLDLDYIVNTTVHDVLLAKKHAKGETGPGTILFEASALGSLLAYAFMPALKGENVVREKSKLADKKDNDVASKALTFTDDGRFKGGYATALFDGEGVPQQKTSIIEKGKLRSFLWNNYWANRHGETSTGNAQRNLRTGVVETAPTNMVVSGGKHSLEDMLSEIKSGYLIKGLQGAHSSNQETGDYSVVGNPAFRIIDGELIGAVHGLMLAGNAFDLIKNVAVVGSDVRSYLVGAGGSFIAPSIQFSDIQVVAKAD